MKRYLWLVILGMLPFFMQAQKKTADEIEDAKQNGQVEEGEEENKVTSLLYKVSRDDGQLFYVFGTIHLISEEQFEFPEKYKNIFNECEKLVLELDMDDPEIQTTLMSQLAAKDGETLDKLLGEEDFNKASQFFEEKLSMDLNLFKGLKPFYLNNLLYPTMIEGEIKSYELYLTQLAQETGKEVQGLETVEFQVGLFDNIPAKEQAKMFMDLINNFEKNKKMFADLVKYYRHNDPQVLYDFMIDNMEDYKKYKETLLDTRNEQWVQNLSAYTQEGSCFFAVGAGHLGGEMGLLNLLKQEGYRLEAIE